MTLPSIGEGRALDGNATVFCEPWEAHAFALAVALHQRGLFSWPEWTQALAEQIAKTAGTAETENGDPYYRHWLSALETLVAAKGASSHDELSRYVQAWDRAASRTPHGQAIELRAEDLQHE